MARSKKPDGAQKIADNEYHDIESPGAYDDCDKRYLRRMRNALATSIRRLVAREVRKERERCVQIVRNEHADRIVGARGEGAWACENILRKITETTP